MELESLVKVVEAILVILAVFVPGFAVYLKKASGIARKAAERSEAEEQLLLVVGEALADGNVDNEEIKLIVQKGRAAGVETKELIMEILELFRKTK